MNTETLKDLCMLCAPSGCEKNISDYIEKHIKNREYSFDSLGNMYVPVKGLHHDKKVMVCAHTDEVGMIATYTDTNGMICFSPVGGIDKRIFPGKRVISEDGVTGVIGIKAIHQQTAEERKSAVPVNKLFIDTGYSTKESTEKFVRPGTYFSFYPNYREFSDGFIAAKALDDRAGVFVMLDLLTSGFIPYYDTDFIFTVQEEVGTRGAAVAAYNSKPDIAYVLETTTAADIAGVTGSQRMCELGHGAVISFMDRGTIYDRGLYNLAMSTAKKNNIRVQPKRGVAGGNDSAAIHKSIGGIRTLAISLACRYLHSPVCIIAKKDIDSYRDILTYLLSEKID